MTQQEGYLNRVQTITTYEEVGEESALSRVHFWQVAVRMAEAYPFGVGLFNYPLAYDRFDDMNGEYGSRRAVHSSHFQVLAETGFPGIAVWVLQFATAFVVAHRIRRRAKTGGLSSEDRVMWVTAANGLSASMMAFLVGGSFIALALNDVTWLTFAFLAALDRLSAATVREYESRVSVAASSGPSNSIAQQPKLSPGLPRPAY